MTKEEIYQQYSQLSDEDIGLEYLKLNETVSSAGEGNALQAMLATSKQKLVVLDIIKERNINLPELITKLNTRGSREIESVKSSVILRLVFGLIISIIGIALTLMSEGNVLFYGAIFGGLFMALGAIYGLYQIKKFKKN